MTPPWQQTRPLVSDAKQASAQYGLQFLVIVVGCLWLAPRNVRRNSADVAGAIKLATSVFVIAELCWLLETSHHASMLETSFIFQGLSRSVAEASLLALAYLSLEPLLRRLWPSLLISWSRLMQGQLRDQLIGRDLLIAVTAAGLYSVIQGAVSWHLIETGFFKYPMSHSIEYLASNSLTVALLGESILSGMWFTLFFFMVFTILLKFVLRKSMLVYLSAVTICSLLEIIPWLQRGGMPVELLLLAILSVLLPFTVMMRFGILPAVGYWMFMEALELIKTADASMWYFNATLFVTLLILATIVLSFRMALAGRPLGVLERLAR